MDTHHPRTTSAKFSITVKKATITLQIEDAQRHESESLTVKSNNDITQLGVLACYSLHSTCKNDLSKFSFKQRSFSNTRYIMSSINLLRFWWG